MAAFIDEKVRGSAGRQVSGTSLHAASNSA